MGGTFVSYLRVSTDKQGRSGLGIEAQRAAVASYLSGAGPLRVRARVLAPLFRAGWSYLLLLAWRDL